MSQSYTREMTALMYSMATSKYLSLSQAVQQLKENAHVRTVRETLAHFAGIPADDRAALQAQLTQALLSSQPDARQDSVERKVRMWLKDDAQTLNKKSAIQLCFALGLSFDKAERMLMRLCEEGFHWRDPQEIIFIYALLRGMKYPQALELYDRMEQKGLLKRRRSEDGGMYTEQARSSVIHLADEAELEAFLSDASRQLGAYHNTAYSLFMDFLELLGLPQLNDSLPDVKAMPMRDVISTYLHNSFIPRMRRSSGKDSASEQLVLSALQRDIRQNWPDEATLSRMIHRETDVSRKVLVLLFLATDGGDSLYGDLSDQDSNDLFQDMYERMNSMLTDCGFAPLDSRVPFDWMVLYCMCADESIFIDGRIQHFLAEIFPSTGAETELAMLTEEIEKW